MDSKSKLVDLARQRDAKTHNDAITHSTSLNNVLDFFFIAGASRQMSPSEIITSFERACMEDEKLALKALFWARDVRGGAGERRIFQIIYKHVWRRMPDVAETLLPLIPKYGRWDDVWNSSEFDKHTKNPAVLRFLKEYFEMLMDVTQTYSLMAKWFPRKGPVFEHLRQSLNYTPYELRKQLVRLSSTVENKMCKKTWETIEYSQVPSVAANKYRKAFLRNDRERYVEFIEAVKQGKASIKADAIFPHDIVRKIVHPFDTEKPSKEVLDSIQAQWTALPNYMENTQDERIIPMCDVSGSMWMNDWLPMLVSLSLGTYISERNEGVFKDAFITFTSAPTMQYLQGDLYRRIKGIMGPIGYDTNLQAAFKLLLDTGIANNLSQAEMPTKILVISDMEFNHPAVNRSKTNFDVIREQYAQAGYEPPILVFWNVNGRLGNVPVAHTDPQVGLVSGFSPAVLKNILQGKSFTPVDLMLDVLMSDRYSDIDW